MQTCHKRNPHNDMLRWSAVFGIPPFDVRAWMIDYIPLKTMGCNKLSMHQLSGFDSLVPTVCGQVYVQCGSSQWRHNEHDGISNHQLHDCILNRLFRRRSKKTSKWHITGLCVGNSPVTGEFRAQRASNVENVIMYQGHLYYHEVTLIRPWISNYTHYEVCD